jgi:hypothetical protein
LPNWRIPKSKPSKVYRKVCALTWKKRPSLAAASLPIGRCPERIWLTYDLLPRICARSTCRTPCSSIKYFKTPDGEASGTAWISSSYCKTSAVSRLDKPFHRRRLRFLIGGKGFQQRRHLGQLLAIVRLGGPMRRQQFHVVRIQHHGFQPPFSYSAWLSSALKKKARRKNDTPLIKR